MSIIIIFILSLISISLLVCNIVQYHDAFELRNKSDKREEELNRMMLKLSKEINSTKEMKEDIFKVSPGDRGIMHNYPLRYIKDEVDFKVTYEVEILEVSAGKFKIRAIDYTSLDNVANEPARKNGILEYMKDKWIDKSGVEIVVDSAKRRDNKINQIVD
jgi:hypothetical protein